MLCLGKNIFAVSNTLLVVTPIWHNRSAQRCPNDAVTGVCLYISIICLHLIVFHNKRTSANEYFRRFVCQSNV